MQCAIYNSYLQSLERKTYTRLLKYTNQSLR